MGIGDWGLGIWDWGLGGVGQTQNPTPQKPNQQIFYIKKKKKKIIKFNI